MDKKMMAQMLADKIQPFIMLIDGLAESLTEEEIDLLKESKETLVNHISMQHSAMALTLAFGINTDTTEEEYKVKTLESLIELLKVRQEYKEALIEQKQEQMQLAKNRAELMNIFGNL